MPFLDSSVWFSYFFGESGGKQAKDIIESDEPILLSVINLIEIYSKYLLRSPLDAEEKRNFLLSRCELVGVSKDIALEASRLKAKHQLAIADAIILATAQLNKATLITTDKDFEGLKGVRLLKRR
ncbi:type II toxin-antitoxin system VapC family toxin [Candidatus Micrarchaeota archaeon]|nr:type II toxin-antitoxin system VapC family toxin [Candidatus Micrarchaeota archaeon]